MIKPVKTGLFSSAIFLLLFFSISCKKPVSDEVPILKTASVTVLSASSVKCGGQITSEGSASVAARGVCWSLTKNPSVLNSDSMTVDGNGIGVFSSTIPGLKPGISYNVWAYAKNSAGTGYGNMVVALIAPILPTVSTYDITAITDTTASCGGDVLSDGGALILERGICWGTAKSPVRSSSSLNPYTSDGKGLGNFTSFMSKLAPNSTYYVRAYATNSVGTAYGAEVSFTPSKLVVKDMDGNFYHFVKLGTQVWMVGNLKTTKYSDGSPIPFVDDASSWANKGNPGYCWYNGDDTNKNVYGALYNWYAVNTGNLCPTGYHVPTDDEWTTLTSYLGDVTVAGGKLKETGVLHWATPNAGATNETAFTALPGGYRTNTGLYDNLGNYGNWWSATSDLANVAYYRYIYYGNSAMTKNFVNQKYGLSVRCLKN